MAIQFAGIYSDQISLIEIISCRPKSNAIHKCFELKIIYDFNNLYTYNSS